MDSEENIRPDPDELLALLKSEDEKSRQGKLKIFFGMCAGVGKTYSMLESGIIDRSKGHDIVIAYIETHKRPDTTELVKGFELIPRKRIEYKGVFFEEPDIEAVIARKPHTVIIDELAHTNAVGSVHLKRYQDILEVLDNGINVYTTLNVQHLESRTDTVSQITGIIVRETLPDEIFEKADEVELVDITPDELLQRFEDGKIYAPDQSREAVNNFFKRGNITALREMSLRIVADRVDSQLRAYMQKKHIHGPWKSGLHLMAVIGPSPQSAKLIRWAKSLSYTMGASLMALYVESGRKLTLQQKEQLDKNRNLARQLGAEVMTATGVDIVKTIINTARRENITHIIVGKPRRWNLRSYFVVGNFVNRLIKYSGNIDVYVLGTHKSEDNKYMQYLGRPRLTSGISQYILAALTVIISGTIFFPFQDLTGYQVVAYALLITISVLALFIGIGPILMAAALSAAIWDFFFIPPLYTFHVNKTEDILMLLMYFIIATTGGIMTSRVRKQAKLARERELRTSALYQISRDLSVASGVDEVIRLSVSYIRKYSGFDSSVILQTGYNVLSREIKPTDSLNLTESDISVAEWTFMHAREAGKYTDTLPSANCTTYPLLGNRMKLGVVILRLTRRLTAEEEEFWNTVRTQIANSLEREFLNDIARRSSVLEESDKLYKSLFNSISHEFRIPVATIMGASENLMTGGYDKEARLNLSLEINRASVRLNRLIENLLGMSRLESGRISIRCDWYDVHDLANKVIESLSDELHNYNSEINIQDDIPLIYFDFGLMEQVLHNLLLNSVQYSKPGTTIRLKMFKDHNNFVLQVMDRGRGFPEDEKEKVFNKFYRVEGSLPGGTGLGLSIVKGFVAAHGGTVSIENRKNGGSVVTAIIPIKSDNK